MNPQSTCHRPRRYPRLSTSLTCCGLALLVASPGVLEAEVTMETVAYGGWTNCVRLSNPAIEVVATTDVGPRVMRLARIGGTNIFKEWPDQLGKTGGKEWRIYGGHRLWHAPEVQPRTYAPDNEAVKWKWTGKSLTLTQNVESQTGLQKEVELFLHGSEPEVEVVHRLINRSPWDITAAPWALSVCQGPGRALVPQEPVVPHSQKLLPGRTMSLWGYTDMADPRYWWGTHFVGVSSDEAIRTSQKIGFMNTTGWAAFQRGNEVFLKRFGWFPGATYTDLGCNLEVFTSGDMLELETLGPETSIPPGGTVEHTERWYVFAAELGGDNAKLKESLDPLVARTRPVTR